MPFCASLSIGVNVFIVIVILTLGFLFSLPLKFILTDDSVSNTKIVSIDDQKKFSTDFRGLRLCENLGYVSFIESLFISCGYDGNCTEIINGIKEASPIIEIGGKISHGGKQVENYNGNFSENERKSVSIAGHIIGVMLVLSALAALVEVLRVRLFEAKQPDHGDGPPQHHGVRRCSSLIDFSQRRKVKKETVQAQKSFEIHGMMHRSPLRLLAARPPPLLRRSSSPAHCLSSKDFPAFTTGPRLSRRPSLLVDWEEDSNGLTDFRRHSRLIRRH